MKNLFTASEIARIRSRQDFRERMEVRGSDTFALRPKDFPAFIQQELALWAKVVKQANVKVGHAPRDRASKRQHPRRLPPL